MMCFKSLSLLHFSVNTFLHLFSRIFMFLIYTNLHLFLRVFIRRIFLRFLFIGKLRLAKQLRVIIIISFVFLSSFHWTIFVY